MTQVIIFVTELSPHKMGKILTEYLLDDPVCEVLSLVILLLGDNV